MTELRRIELSSVLDLDQTIKDLCDTMEAANFKLSSTFVYLTQLVLIFQK